jgi:ATP-dependent DNA helicase RecG
VQDVPLEDISSLRRNPVLADVMAQLDYMEKRGSGLKRICNETKALESYREDRKPVFKSSPSQFMTVIYSVDYIVTGKATGKDTFTLPPFGTVTLGSRFLFCSQWQG